MHENTDLSVKCFTNPFDMNPLSLGLCEAEAEGVHGQCRYTKQLHRRADQARRNDIVYEERAVVRKEHTSVSRKQGSTSVSLQINSLC